MGVLRSNNGGRERDAVTGDGLGDFQALFERLRRFAFVVGSLDMEADDLVQEALARTLSRHRFADLDDPGRYLRTVIVRLASNGRRQAGKRRRALERLGPAAETQPTYPSDLAELERLSARDRAAVYLFVVERRSHSEIATILGCTEEASRQRVARALARLRDEMNAEADNG